MNKLFTTLKNNVGVLIQDQSSAMLTNIGVWINNRYVDILRRYDWEELFDTCSFTSTGSTSAYGLEDNFDEIIKLFDTTNEKVLNQMSLHELYTYRYNNINTIGEPDVYVISREPVKAQPASAQKITMKSSSASDITQSVLLRGIVSDYETYETISLSGATVATAASSYSKILALSKSAVTSGYVTVYENDATTVLAVMPGERVESQYVNLILNPVPSNSTTVYRVIKKRKIIPLTQSYDIPVVDCSEALEYGAIAEGWRYKRQFSKASQYEAIYEQELNRLIFQRVKKADEIIQFTPEVYNRDEGIL